MRSATANKPARAALLNERGLNATCFVPRLHCVAHAAAGGARAGARECARNDGAVRHSVMARHHIGIWLAAQVALRSAVAARGGGGGAGELQRALAPGGDMRRVVEDLLAQLAC